MEKKKDSETREENERVERVKRRRWKCGRVRVGIGAVRDFEEGNISIDVRFIDLPAARPYEMAGAALALRATS